MKGTIDGYGEVEFKSTRWGDNFYDLYAVAICDPETDEIVDEEHYLDEGDYRAALDDTPGREVMDEREELGSCWVTWPGDEYGDTFDAECTWHFAYVIDKE